MATSKQVNGFISDADMNAMEIAQPKAKKGSGFISDDEMTKIETQSKSKSKEGNPKTAALEGFGEGATLGYLNNIQAALEKPAFAVMSKLTGQEVEGDDYTKARDYYNNRQEKLKEENPVAFGAGQVAGTIASSMPVARAAQGATALARAGQAAKAGAAYGAIQNTSETEGEMGNLDLGERAMNAGFGAATGAAASLGTDAIAKGASKIGDLKNKAGEKLKDIAETQAFKSTGAMLKDFRNADGDINEIGRYLLDKGMKVGDSVDDIARKTLDLKKSAGKNLEAVYSQADDAMKAAMNKKGFDPIADKQRILDSAKKELGDTVGADGAINKLSDYLDSVSNKHVDSIFENASTLPPEYARMNPKRTNDIKGAIDEQINYARNPLSKEPASEKAFYGARKELNKIIDESINDLSGSGASQALKAANKEYSIATRVNNISKDRVNRESANKMFGLTDTIAGGASATYGAVTGDWETAAGAFVAKKGLEKYGTTGLAKLADFASKKLLTNPQMKQLATQNPEAFKASVFGFIERMSENSSFKPASSMAEQKELKGFDKWAQNGANQLKEQGIDDETIEKLQKSKSGKSLLIEASDAKPNSKRMESVIKKIQTGMSEGGQ